MHAKWGASSQVSDALDNKVNKPSAEDVARRSRQPKKDTFSSKLKDNDKGNKSGVAGSTKPSGPSVTKYTDTLQAIKDANAKEEAVKKRLEEKKQAAMDKVKGAYTVPCVLICHGQGERVSARASTASGVPSSGPPLFRAGASDAT